MYNSLYAVSFAVYGIGLLLYFFYCVQLSADVREGRIPTRDTEK